jgi:phospholipid/cholesterol/gamma-HCH transport system ATP-binding protein
MEPRPSDAPAPRHANGEKREAHVEVKNLTMAYGSFVVMRDLSFTVGKGSIFVIMGGSGSGKSTLLRHMVGLMEPASGEVFYDGESFTRDDPERRKEILRRCGVLYQRGALWSSMTLLENVALPLEEYTQLTPDNVREVASLKLSLVGLKGFDDFYPSQLSGGMQKRAGLARAMALDPEILYFDEPSAGLDPINARHLDELILALRDSLGTTIVVVTHELASIFAIADDSILLDTESKSIIARGNPRELYESSTDERVQRFLRRGEDAHANDAKDSRGAATPGPNRGAATTSAPAPDATKRKPA